MRRSIGTVAVVVALMVGAVACGGSKDAASGSATTAAGGSGQASGGSGGSSSAGGASGSDAVDAYCKKVADLAKLVEEKGAAAASEVQKVSNELKDLSSAAAKDAIANPSAASAFRDCSMDASKRIAESLKPG